MAGKFWKEAALLMVIGKNSAGIHGTNLHGIEVLQFMRSSKSKFMPNAVVPPGGALDAFDVNRQWLDFYEKNGYSKENWKKFRYNAPRPDFYTKNLDTEFPELSFRLCALRETFEETGLILSLDNGTSNAMYNKELANEWMPKVQKNPSDFLRLFEHISQVPDVWSLMEWSAWLTPTSFVGKRRFDTAFFIAFIDKPIPVMDFGVHHIEAEKLMVLDPATTLKMNQNKEIWLAPPQVYELARMCQFDSYEDLKKFSIERSTQGLESWLPVLYKMKDGLISVLPGDYMYPTDPDYYGGKSSLEKDETLDESRDNGSLNRLDLISQRDFRPYVTITPRCSHVNPINIINHSKL